MRRFILALAVLIAVPLSRADALPGPYNYQGCDGIGSCHLITFTFVKHYPQSGVYEAVMSGKAVWLRRGAWADYSEGTAWDSDPSFAYFTPGLALAESRHASNRCQPHTYCAAGTVDVWQKSTPIYPTYAWDPKVIELHLLYQDSPDGPVTTSTLRLDMIVPEPSTYALMAMGLGGLLLASRRRRA